MKCPYCGEEIKNNLPICPNCNENLVNNKQEKTFTVKQLLTSVSLIIVGILIVAFAIAYITDMTKSRYLSQKGYKSITVEYTTKRNMREIFNGLAQAEKDLMDFFTHSKSKENNSKLFGIFMNNVMSYCSNAWDLETSGNSLSDQLKQNGVIISEKISDAMSPAEILKPKVNIVYFDFRGTASLVLNNNYIIKNYSQYLTNDWNTYIEYKAECYDDFGRAYYNDDIETYMKVWKKWHKKWGEFLNQYPDFALNPKIREDRMFYMSKINELSEY